MLFFAIDEVTSIVIENGSSWTRAGFSGDDLPKHIFPTHYGKDTDGNYYIGEEDVQEPTPGKDIYSPMQDGLVTDWDAMVKIWDYTYSDRLLIESSDFPLVTTEQLWNTPQNRVAATEAAFESFRVPAFSILKNPLCAVYGTGKSTALVIDIGSSVASVTPVVEGNILTKGAMHTRFAGDFVNIHILTQLKSRGIKVTPRFLVDRKGGAGSSHETTSLKHYDGITQSFHMFETQRVLDELKETTSQVSEGPNPGYSQNLVRPFEFPDGIGMMFGNERMTTTEPLFNPLRFPLPNVTLGENSMGITDLILGVLKKTDGSNDLYSNLLQYILVTGGTTLLSGFPERLANDMLRILGNFRPMIHATPTAIERKCTVWTGASILASLGSFDHDWISKKEYEEYGPNIVEERFNSKQ